MNSEPILQKLVNDERTDLNVRSLKGVRSFLGVAPSK